MTSLDHAVKGGHVEYLKAMFNMTTHSLRWSIFRSCPNARSAQSMCAPLCLRYPPP